MSRRISADEFINAKKKGKCWAMLTAYDAPTAELLQAAGVDIILVGDSVGMVLLGYENTTPVTMDEMIHHAKAVRRGAPQALVVGDMPLKGVEKGPAQALVSARRFIEEAGCDAVKVEWSAQAPAVIEKLLKNHIPVMGHLGLTPQNALAIGGFKVQATRAPSAIETLRAAELLQARGVFAVLLECVPSAVAEALTRRLKVPVIGIGAGPFCDGQVLVFHDLVGLFSKFQPRFVKRYARLEAPMRKAVESYTRDVRQRKFPAKKNSFSMKKEELRAFKEALAEEGT